MSNLHTRLIGVAALCATLCATAAGQPPTGDAKDQPSKKDDAKKDEAKRSSGTVVKAFELKSTNASEIQQFLVKYFAAPDGGEKSGPLVAADGKTRTVFVRGSAADVDTAGKIVAQLDGGSADGPLQVIRLQSAAVDDVVRVLTALELGSRVYPLQLAGALVIPRNETNTDQIKAVIEKMDEIRLGKSGARGKN
jgi:hypothetical protein